MKKIVILLILVLCISLVYAERTCQDIVEPDTVCEIITPVIDCSTYDLYNSTLELRIDDGGMSQIGTTGMYNFTFNQPDVGSHKILLCDNTTATIEVATYSQKVIYDNNLANSSSIRGDISTVQTESNLHFNSLANITVSEIDAQLNDSHSEGNWSDIGVGGDATSAKQDIILQGIQQNRTSTEDKIDTLANITVSDIDLQLNLSHGEGNWSATGTGVATTINNTAVAEAVWDFNLTSRYPQADDDNYIAALAGEQLLQGLRFIIQIIFGGY